MLVYLFVFRVCLFVCVFFVVVAYFVAVVFTAAVVVVFLSLSTAEKICRSVTKQIAWQIMTQQITSKDRQ